MRNTDRFARTPSTHSTVVQFSRSAPVCHLTTSRSVQPFFHSSPRVPNVYTQTLTIRATCSKMTAFLYKNQPKSRKLDTTHSLTTVVVSELRYLSLSCTHACGAQIFRQEGAAFEKFAKVCRGCVTSVNDGDRTAYTSERVRSALTYSTMFVR